jgi:hypothetical protein
MIPKTTNSVYTQAGVFVLTTTSFLLLLLLPPFMVILLLDDDKHSSSIVGVRSRAGGLTPPLPPARPSSAAPCLLVRTMVVLFSFLFLPVRLVD